MCHPRGREEKGKVFSINFFNIFHKIEFIDYFSKIVVISNKMEAESYFC